MARAYLRRARISGVVTAIPSTCLRIEDEVDYYAGDIRQVERLRKTIGVNVRHVVDDNTTAGDLCEVAAKALFDRGKYSIADTDCVLCITQTPDFFQPPTSACIQGRLGLSDECAAFDINLGCSGFVYGLWLGGMMIETGSCQQVLLLAGDTISRCVNLRDRSVAPLFGDAGSATLIVRSEEAVPAWYCLHTDGTRWDAIQVPAGAFRRPKSKETGIETADLDGNYRSLDNLHVHGADVFNFSIKEEPESVRRLLSFSGHQVSDVDYFIFHQANRYIVSNIARRLRIPPEKAPSETFSRYGNQSCASIPGTICDVLGPLAMDGPIKIVMSGFGVGLSWASTLTSLKHLEVCEMVCYST